MRKYWPAGTKTASGVSTAEVVRFNESDIPAGEAVTRYLLGLTGTARDYDSLDNIAVKAGGQLIWNVNELQHAALISRLSKRAGPATTDVRFTIPFDLLGAFGPVVSMPRNLAAAVELSIDATPSAAGVNDERMASATFGPIPLTVISCSNASRSAVDSKPYSVSSSSRTCRCVQTVTSSPSAGRAASDPVDIQRR